MEQQKYLEEDEPQSLVMDAGSGFVRYGFSGDDAPRAVFPSIIGRPKHPGMGVAMYSRDAYVGDEAQSKRGILNMQYPINKGIITNWDDFEKLCHHTFYNELKIAPEEHPLLFALNIKNSNINKEKLTQIIFETFNIPVLNITMQTVLALYASGRFNGIVIDSGYGSTRIVPIYQGHALKYGVNELEIGGKDLTDYLMKILNDRGYELTTMAEREIVRDIKEKLSYIAIDYKNELKKIEILDNTIDVDNCYEYTLPDGKQIVAGSAKIMCPEVLFKPDMIGININNKYEGIHKLLNDSIIKCDIDIGFEKELYSNIVLNGGCSMFPGIENRLKMELKGLVNPNININVIASPERFYSVWIGGSILSSLSEFHKTFCLDKDEYDEYGPTAIHLRCF